MKVLNLRCAHDHRFEGWFASLDELESQQQRGLVECPVCGDRQIERLPSAPRLNTLALRDAPPVPAVPAAPAGGVPTPEQQAQAIFLRAVRHVMENTEDVGDRFPEEARRIHYGESAQRGIRGQATPEDADALREEGIEVMAIPVPPALKGPLQ